MPDKVIHSINLLGPWQYDWLDGTIDDAALETADLETPRLPLLSGSRIKMPASIQQAFGSACGRVRFSRRFQRPTNLDEFERVWLSFRGVGGAAAFLLNDVEIGRVGVESETVDFDVTDQLSPSNNLAVEIEWPPGVAPDRPGGLYGPVVIEMRELEVDNSTIGGSR